jgi:hypothetical protein
MNEIVTEVVDYIDKTLYALLITVGEENKPFAREIGPFVNIGLDVYFVDYSKSTRTVKIDV